MSLLEIHKLSIGYGGKALSSDISVSLKKGQLVGLIGQNGVGKSTLIRTFCGLQKPIAGEILLNGKSIDSYSRKELSKKISIVLTGKPELMNLSVIELIALGRYPYSGWLGTLNETDKLKIEEAISKMRINYIATKKLFELSDGQLQKVMIGRALAQDTEIIMLDEPTSHLDLRNKLEVLNLLKEISKSGKTVLISTHEVEYATNVCDLFWCMDFGSEFLVGDPKKLVQQGKVQEYLHVNKEVMTKK